MIQITGFVALRGRNKAMLDNYRFSASSNQHFAREEQHKNTAMMRLKGAFKKKILLIGCWLGYSRCS